jgi:hypothetical protein
MTRMSRPSKVDALKRGIGTAAPAPEIRASRADSEVPTSETPTRPRPEKPVRFTLDLDRDRHHLLKNYATQIDAKGASEVMRALLDELRDDPELADRVRARVWANR